MFGQVSLIEKILEKNFNSQKINRIFFSGTLFNHLDEQIGCIRDRTTIYSKIKKYIYNPGILSYDRFLYEIRNSKYSLDLNGVGEIRNSKYSLDLNGVGDPNKRTFEILSQGSIRISESNDLKWPFDEEFNHELKFKDEHEFYKIIEICNKEPDFYNKCLSNQNKIYKKYFNLEWIKSYILKFII